MFLTVLFFIVGLILLIKGGDWFVDGATGIAKVFRIPEILIVRPSFLSERRSLG